LLLHHSSIFAKTFLYQNVFRIFSQLLTVVARFPGGSVSVLNVD
jgi:hypothetical protein